MSGNKLEKFFQPDPIEHNKDKQTGRIQLCELVKQNDFGLDQPTFDVLKLILEQYDYLSHVEIVFISPEEEPNTGGFFDRVRVDEQTFVPTIFIVSMDKKHLCRLKDVRRSSSTRVAEIPGISFSRLSPNLLRQFIIAHELGHASDYIRNYETNPDYHGSDAAEKWDLHYESNLLTMPVPGFDPVDLREELSKFDNLEDFIKANPNLVKIINTSKIETKQDLINAQEAAYRASVYESYADNFAAAFLKKNAVALNITELIDSGRRREST
ncbi:MAG: hypothetical protein PHW15_02230 [Patescibacteria group bacterium]|jgi:hypothetical protein|nr:hypothetical protein [Patescibacteria group bacterium]MDD5173101.1 hypothetical protein [Patescibacteria group bacterium]